MPAHRAFIATAAFLAIATISGAVAQEAPSPAELEILGTLQGHWSGQLQRGSDVAAIELDLRVEKGELAGTFDWPDLGYLGANILSARLVDDRVRISLPLPVGALRLSAQPDPSRLEGVLGEVTRRANEWVTLPDEGRFDLHRAAPENRPYRVEPARFSSDGVMIAGTIYVASGNGRKPAVVFIHGSGDSDRSDGAFYADQFARSGIVTLVYDKRGVGESAGQWRQGGYEDLARDAHAGLALLRSRPDVDPDRIGYVARSEGAWVAPRALHLGGASFLGVISGPTVSVQDEDLDYYRIALREAGFTGAEFEDALDLVRLRHRAMLGKATAESLEQAVARSRESRWFPTLDWDDAEDPASMPFRLATLGYDPAPDLARIGVPSFWLYGTDDKTIPAGDSVTRLMALGMEPRPAISVLPRADHSLARSEYPRLPGGVQSSATLLADWIAAQGKDPRDDAEFAQRIRAAVDAEVAQGFSGAVVVAEGERILVDGVFGSMDGKSLPPDGRFLMASAAKQFTSAAILRLQERGLLQLDDPITKYLPGVPAEKRTITLRQLLSHTSGLAQGYASETAANWHEAVGKILAEPLESKPGERFIYSNENYALGIAVVEATAHIRYADFVREEFLEPLGLRDTGQMDGTASIARLSPLLEALPPRLADLRWGGHGYFTTARDFLAWYRALRTGLVLKPASVEALFAPQVKIGEGQSALGWFLGATVSGEPTVFTRGNEDIGANSLLYAYPKRDAVIVVLTHAGDKNDDLSWSRAMQARIEAILTGAAPP